ncbi:MAG TPA: methyltransferase domain-containing protein [Dehalococcoidia bacterium]|nr:methyltransferase domain-containing protein [Dehalococcoidia bacterium]
MTTQHPAAEWDHRYREGYGRPEASPLLVEMRHLLPPAGEALDIATGAGRNALYLARLGFRVMGIVFSRVAVKMCLEQARALGLTIDAILADLERFPLPTARYDLIVTFYYHQRSICPRIEAALKPGGVVVFETYTLEQLHRGFEGGPRDPDLLLKPGELRGLFPRLQEIYYREGIFDEGHGPKAIASLIARRPL